MQNGAGEFKQKTVSWLPDKKSYIRITMTHILRQYSRNIFSGYTALAIRAVVTFFLTPFFIRALGDDSFGLFMLAVALLNYTTVLDLGLKQALIYFVAGSLGRNDFDSINSHLQSAFVVYLASALAVLGTAYVFSFFAADYFEIPENLLGPARTVILLVGLDTAVNFAFAGWGGSLGAFHRYDLANGLIIAENIIRAVLLVLVLKSGGGLTAFAAVFPAVSLARNLAGMVLLKRKFPTLIFGLGHIGREAFRRLFHYGRTSFIISVAWLLIVNMDNILAGYFLGTASVTYYALALTIIVSLRQIIHSLSIPLRPLLSHHHSQGEIEIIRRLYLKSTALVTFLAFVIAGGIFSLADEFIGLWMGPGYDSVALILKILIIPTAVFFSQAAGVSYLYSSGNHRFLMYLVIIEGLVNLGVSLVLVSQYGLMGIAVGTIIPQIPLYLFVLPRYINRGLGISVKNYMKAIVGFGFGAGVVTMLTVFMVKQVIPPDTWPGLIITAGAASVAALIYGKAIMTADDRAYLKEMLAFRKEAAPG